jgi:glutamate-1-semialdehyde 2,1-aminomutase
MMPFDNRRAVERIVGTHGHELAAVIVEPAIGAGGVIVPQPGFLQFLREITRQYGIVLIFDEVIA